MWLSVSNDLGDGVAHSRCCFHNFLDTYCSIDSMYSRTVFASSIFKFVRVFFSVLEL